MKSQSLIPNGDFEQKLDCPDGLRQIEKVEHWFSASTGTPEYFHSCGFSAPINPKSGEAMIGLIAYAAYDSDLEYVGVKLTEPLVAGQLYCFSFYIKADEENPLFNSNIDAYFSKEKLKMAYWKLGSISSQVKVKDIPNSNNWTYIQATFRAEGEELYLCFGNFSGKENVQIQWNRKPSSKGWYSYYYIDDVRLYPTESSCIDSGDDFRKSNDRVHPQAFEKNITLYFDSDEFALSLEEQNRLKGFLNQLPKGSFIQLSLSGHTDTDASEEYNMNLSLRRVEEVGRMIEKLGSYTTIKQWEGETRLLNPSQTESEKALNRRVEINYISN